MGKSDKKREFGRRGVVIVPILLIFCILGAVVFSMARKISAEMSAAAVDNLSESLTLIKGTIEAIMHKEAQFQQLLAQEVAVMEDPDEFIRVYQANEDMVKISLIFSGEDEGISNTGDVFSDEDLDFSAGRDVEGLPISETYINSMGAWAYAMKCPVIKRGREIATLYVEYLYDSFDRALPSRFYNGSATLYLMDGRNQRFVLKPKGMGERDAGHLNLEDFSRANKIIEGEIQRTVSKELEMGNNIMFYHQIQRRDSLVYMWSVNRGAIYLVGYVPVEAIQREGNAVNQNIFSVAAIMLIAFFICCLLYFLNERQNVRIRKEREKERETHNKQLAEALQAAQIANKSKTTFLSNMSHDIRTPMNAILGFATLLSKSPENTERVREYTKKIMASGQHLLSLINDILDVSKIESGKVVLTIGEFALSNMISSVDAIIRPAAKAKGQSFHVEVTGIKHELLIGDETRINQILINLLSNAVKYTQEGGNIWFRLIGLKRRSEQFEHIRIEVEDDGFGMTPEYLEVIFDAFTRAENSTTNKVQGTGLGMAITKSFVELMGGTIEVASEVNQGSLFTVELELRIPGRQSDQKFWQKYGIFRILATGQEESVKNIQTLMDDSEVRVDTAFRLEEGVSRNQNAINQNEPYQVLLLDGDLPDIDCAEAVHKFRAASAEGAMILLLAANDWEEPEKEGGQSGADGILLKPFFVSALKEKIVELHAQEETPRQGSEEEVSLEGYHFLVAEDVQLNAEILLEVLSMNGATAEIAVNGKLAAEYFERSQPGTFDAVLMDVQMPVMNGYEATRAIRALNREDAAEIPIIAMTANAFSEDVKDAMDAGMNAHISKPIDMELLKETLKQYTLGKEK